MKISAFLSMVLTTLLLAAPARAGFPFEPPKELHCQVAKPAPGACRGWDQTIIDLAYLVERKDSGAARVGGTFKMHQTRGGCYPVAWYTEGKISGTLTPVEWYGGSFSVTLTAVLQSTHQELEAGELTLLRQDGKAWISLPGASEMLDVSCAGELP